MSKKIMGIVTLILLALCVPAVCDAEPEPAYANHIAESILLATNEDDYARYSEHFDEATKNALPEPVFRQSKTAIKARIGDHVSKEFWKVENQGLYTAVIYKARFTLEPEAVLVRVVFSEIDNEVYVSGLWFDSPRLRQK